jgi:AcrR family transcriptional regulator
MRSASTLERSPAEDLTARATIREAALELFAQRGYAGVSVRQIAAAAGVSPALLFHHYGSKQGLSDAVDEWLVATVAVAVAGGAADGDLDGAEALTGRFRRFADVGRAHPAVSDYVGRILSEGGEPARGLFDRMVSTTSAELAELERRGLMRESDDEVGRALLLLFLELGPILLRPLVERQLGDELFSERSVERWVSGCATVLGEGVLTARGRRG